MLIIVASQAQNKWVRLFIFYNVFITIKKDWSYHMGHK